MSAGEGRPRQVSGVVRRTVGDASVKAGGRFQSVRVARTVRSDRAARACGPLAASSSSRAAWSAADSRPVTAGAILVR